MSQKPTLSWEGSNPHVMRLTLQNGGGNTLSIGLLEALNAALGTLEAETPRALVLAAGGDRAFSLGFDLAELLTYDARELRRLLRLFQGLLARLVALPCATVAAVGGSALSAGFLLASACDLRVVADGDHSFGLAGVERGVPVAAGSHALLAARTGQAMATRLSLFGTLLTPDGALESGWADMIGDDAVSDASGIAESLSERPGDGLAVTKRGYGLALAERMRALDARGFEGLAACWLSEPLQAHLASIAAAAPRDEDEDEDNGATEGAGRDMGEDAPQ